MDKQFILDHLQEEQQYAISEGVNPEHIIGIFLYGSQNYGFADSRSDIDSLIIVVPAFKNFCLDRETISKELHYGEEHIIIKDICTFRKLLIKQNVNFVETLFTEYYILNPVYEKDFIKYFLDQKETIAHYDRSRTVKAACGQALNGLKRGNAPMHRKLYNGIRLYYFAKDYISAESATPYADCLRPEGELYDFLWSLKYRESDFSKDMDAMTTTAKEYEKKIAILMENSQVLDSPQHDEALSAMDDGVLEILTKSFKLDVLEEGEHITREEFLAKLTNREKDAYYSIVETTHGNGDFAVSQLMNTYDISRNVYINLIRKMRESHIANIHTKGPYGYHIEITQSEMLAEAIGYKGDNNEEL